MHNEDEHSAFDAFYAIAFTVSLFAALFGFTLALIQGNPLESFARTVVIALTALLITFQMSRMYSVLHTLEGESRRERATHFLNHVEGKSRLTERTIRILLCFVLVMSVKNNTTLAEKLAELVHHPAPLTEAGAKQTATQPTSTTTTPPIIAATTPRDFQLQATCSFATYSCALFSIFALLIAWDSVIYFACRKDVLTQSGDTPHKANASLREFFYIGSEVKNPNYFKSAKFLERVLGLGTSLLTFLYFLTPNEAYAFISPVLFCSFITVILLNQSKTEGTTLSLLLFGGFIATKNSFGGYYKSRLQPNPQLLTK